MSENENDENPQEQGPLTRRGIKITAMPKANGLLHVSGLWSKKQRDGETFFSGMAGTHWKILIFKNTKKNSPNQPDWNLYLSPAQVNNQ